jgi:hypothetical protein
LVLKIKKTGNENYSEQINKQIFYFFTPDIASKRMNVDAKIK